MGILLLLGSSCQKESVERELTQAKQNLGAGSNANWAINTDNPYDATGDHHNQILDYLLLQPYPDPTVPGFASSMSGYIAGYANTNLSDPDCPNCTVGSDELLNSMNTVLDGSQEDDANWLASLNMSESGKQYLVQVFNEMNSPMDVQLTAQTIKQIEGNVILSDLTVAEKEAVLRGTSVARHSMLYWNNQEEAIDSEWFEDDDVPNDIDVVGKAKINKDKVKKVAKADLKGAVKGAIVGAITGGGALLYGAAYGAAESVAKALNL